MTEFKINIRIQRGFCAFFAGPSEEVGWRDQKLNTSSAYFKHV
jgi:hypothetical protein